MIEDTLGLFCEVTLLNAFGAGDTTLQGVGDKALDGARAGAWIEGCHADLTFFQFGGSAGWAGR